MAAFVGDEPDPDGPGLGITQSSIRLLPFFSGTGGGDDLDGDGDMMGDIGGIGGGDSRRLLAFSFDLRSNVARSGLDDVPGDLAKSITSCSRSHKTMLTDTLTDASHLRH